LDKITLKRDRTFTNEEKLYHEIFSRKTFYLWKI